MLKQFSFRMSSLSYNPWLAKLTDLIIDLLASDKSRYFVQPPPIIAKYSSCKWNKKFLTSFNGDAIWAHDINKSP